MEGFEESEGGSERGPGEVVCEAHRERCVVVVLGVNVDEVSNHRRSEMVSVSLAMPSGFSYTLEYEEETSCSVFNWNKVMCKND